MLEPEDLIPHGLNKKIYGISIIVITKDNPLGLFKTLDSIAMQAVVVKPNHLIHKEVIIVDGSAKFIPDPTLRAIMGDSTTLHIIRESNPKGIYHAMNIGLENSTGEFVHFLNSGDEYYSTNSLSLLIEPWVSLPNSNSLYYELNLVFGQALIIPTFQLFLESWLFPDSHVCNINKWLRHYNPNHQAIVVKGNWARANPYSLQSPQSADRLWMRKAMVSNTSFKYIKHPVVKFYLDGVSSQLPNFKTLLLRLNEPSRSTLQKFSEIIKFVFYPLHNFYPFAMRFRSWLVGLLT